MKRQVKIANELLSKEGAMTISDLAKSLSVSSRTIRYDLTKVETMAIESGLVLVRKPGVGVSLEGYQKNKEAFLVSLQQADDAIEPYSPDDRKRMILKVLLTSKKVMTIDELSKLLYVSRTAIHKDLNRVEQWLTLFSLKLYRKQSHGISIVGGEVSIRKAMSALVLLESRQDIAAVPMLASLTRLDYESVKRLYGLIPIDYAKLELMLVDLEEDLGFRFSDEAFMSLIIHVAIAMKRTTEGKEIVLAQDLSGQLKEKLEYPRAQSFCEELKETFQVELPESEVGYILLHVLGAKGQQRSNSMVDLELNHSDEEELSVVMAKEIARIAGSALHLPLEQDEQLVNGLILHLRPTIHRIMYNLTLKNPILDNIKETYPDLLGVAWMTSTVFQRYLDKPIREDEVAYIALHIGASVERNRKSIKVVIVCHSGVGTSQFLSARLASAFREIEIIDVMCSKDLEGYSKEAIDFVVTTVPLDIRGNYVMVSPLLTPGDISKINKMILYCGKKEQTKTMIPYLDEALITIVDQESDDASTQKNIKLEAISNMCHQLYQRGFVSKGFEQEVIDREHLASTYIGKQVCIPHGNPKFVYRTGFAVTYFEEPIHCDGEEISVILLISISEKQIHLSSALYRNLYLMIEKDGFLERLKNVDGKAQIMEMLEEL